MPVIRLTDETGDKDICSALSAMASCIALQMNQEFATAWNTGPTNILVGGDLQPGEWPAKIVNVLDDPDALAYHSDDQDGYPTLFVGRDVILNNRGTILTGSNSISAALSHEVLEALADEFCDFWADWRDGVNLVALEPGDPVEDGFYDVSDGKNIVSVSNFVLPEWFRPGSSRRKFDHLGTLTAPLTITAGGYVALRSGQQIFGESMPDWKREVKRLQARRRRARRQQMKRLGIIPDNPQV
jgi:hypothetical protein